MYTVFTVSLSLHHLLLHIYFYSSSFDMCLILSAHRWLPLCDRTKSFSIFYIFFFSVVSVSSAVRASNFYHSFLFFFLFPNTASHWYRILVLMLNKAQNGILIQQYGHKRKNKMPKTSGQYRVIANWLPFEIFKLNFRKSNKHSNTDCSRSKTCLHR